MAVKSAAEAAFLREQNFLSGLASVPVGGHVDASREAPRSEVILANTGFVRLGAHRFVREVALDVEGGPLQNFTSESISGFDCVAILSVHRQKEGENYVMATLESTLRAFPSEVPINVLVGDDFDAYLHRDVLTENLGAEHAGRVHVHLTSRRDARFLAEHMDIKHRAAWNYARALRSYHGARGLLVLEDDIIWSSLAQVYLEKWLGGSHVDFLSLYTRLGYLRPNGLNWGTPITYPRGGVFPRFECTQAVYVGPQLARQLGDFLLLNLQQTSYDWNISAFLEAFGVPMGYAFPSIVQHVGFKSSGLGIFHQSDCFAP